MGRNGVVETVMTRGCVVPDDNPRIVIAGWRYRESLTYAIRVTSNWLEPISNIPDVAHRCLVTRSSRSGGYTRICDNAACSHMSWHLLILSCPCSPAPTHTHTPTHTRTHTQIHTHAHKHTRPHTRTHTCACARTPTPTPIDWA